MTAQSRTVSIGGVTTHYLEAGEGEPLVLIHGGGAGADAKGNWEGCIPEYARHFRVLAVDMIGFGISERPDPATYSYGQTNRNAHMAEFVEKVAGGSAYLIGNSMGGATALGVTIKRPELVKKLVLMGAAGPRHRQPRSLAARRRWAATTTRPRACGRWSACSPGRTSTSATS